MKLNKAFKFRIYPNHIQMALLAKTFGCCRFVYNKMLEDKIKHCQETKENLLVTPAKYKEEFEFLKEVDSYSLCNEQMHLQAAFNNFFRGSKVGFPKFKSRRKDKNSFTTSNVSNTIRVNDKHQIRLPKLGWVNFVEHRKIPSNYKIKSVTVTKTPSGKYYISVLTEYEYKIPERTLDKSKSLGLDYSSHDFYVDNQGKSPENLHITLQQGYSESPLVLSEKISLPYYVAVQRLDPPVKEMTLEEVERELGYRVRIVSEKSIKNKED